MSATVTIPSSSLYWAVLTLPPGAISAARGTQVVRHTRDLDELFEAFVPVAFETVKPAYVVLDKVRVLAVAMDRTALTAACGAETTVVIPASAPGGLMTDAPSEVLGRLNLLWGDLEARPVVKARMRATLTAAAVIVAIAGLAMVGLERRTAALQTAADAEDAATGKALTEMYRKPTREAGLTALDQELSRLTRTRGGAARPSAPTDAADALQRLLAAWPRSTPTAAGGAGGASAAKLRTESVSATADVITLSVAVEQREQAETLSAALRGIPGWQLPQPLFAAAPQGSGSSGGTLSFRLAAAPAAKPSAASPVVERTP
ncbi:MAG: hypothetical protein QM783_05040 [Phycisphaerales bacterium]